MSVPLQSAPKLTASRSASETEQALERSAAREKLRGRTYAEQVAALKPPDSAPEADEAEGWGWMDTLHTGLDVVGLIPMVGEVADATNALIYLAEGDHMNAGLSAMAMVPFVGMAATGVKAVRTGARASDAAASTAQVARKATQEAPKKGVARVVSSLPRPVGLPESWLAKPSKKGGGTKYHSPGNPHHSVRVMPGNPDSPFPNSRKPYVRHVNNGRSLDAHGRPVDVTTAEAHIPLDQFEWPL